MIRTGARIAAAVALAGSAATAAGQAAPEGAQRPGWEPLMAQARKLAASRMNFAIVSRRLQAGAGGTEGGVFVFYNNPDPFCYTYVVPGNWVPAGQANAYRSPDGKAFVGVIFELPRNVARIEGASLIERARNAFLQWYEQTAGRSASGARLGAFESARPGTWKWSGLPALPAEEEGPPPARFVVDLDPDAVVHITVRASADDDALARRIIESLRTTRAPECYFPVLERMLKAAAGER